MKIRLLLISLFFALPGVIAQAQTLTAAAEAAFTAAGSDLSKLAAVAKAYPAEAAAIARLAAKADPVNAAKVAASIAKAVPSQAVNIVREVVKETPTVEAAGAIVGSVLTATGTTASSKIGEIRNISSAAVSSLPTSEKTASGLKAFVQIVASTGAPESAARMGAYDGSGVGIVTISRASADPAKVSAGTNAITSAVNAANIAIANMVPLPGNSNNNVNSGTTTTTPQPLDPSSMSRSS